jgi:hypothetical protein
MEPMTLKVLYVLLLGVVGPSPSAQINTVVRHYDTAEQCASEGKLLAGNKRNWASVGDLGWVCVRFQLHPYEGKHS